MTTTRPPRRRWAALAALGVYTLAVGVFFGCGLSFNPGWANDWPGGVSFPTAVAAFYSVLVFVLLLTAVATVGAVVALGRPPASRRPVLVWLAVAVALALPAAVVTFRWLHAGVWAALPDGYNPHRPPGP